MNSFLLILPLLFFLLPFVRATDALSPSLWPFSKIYAFGDSLTDTGNREACQVPPYGSTYFHKPMHRCSDGRLVIDFVTQYLNLPFLPPLWQSRGSSINGVNFAVGGSTAISHDFYVRNNISLSTTPASIETQLQSFKGYLEKERVCRADSNSTRDCGFENALFWVGEIGGNDFIYTFGSSVPAELVAKLSALTVAGFLEERLEMGAKYVVVLGQEAGGCDVLSLISYPDYERDEFGCVKRENAITYAQNLILLSKIEKLKYRFPDAVIVYADFWNAFRAVFKDPIKYGFTELFNPCLPFRKERQFLASRFCENPKQYVSWNGVHYTEAMNQVMADLFLRGDYCHPPFSSLQVSPPVE